MERRVFNLSGQAERWLLREERRSEPARCVPTALGARECFLERYEKPRCVHASRDTELFTVPPSALSLLFAADPCCWLSLMYQPSCLRDDLTTLIRKSVFQTCLVLNP